jgi:hypothetical protein
LMMLLHDDLQIQRQQALIISLKNIFSFFPL